MIENLLKNLTGGLTEQLTGNVDVDTNKLDDIAEVTTNTFKEGLLDKFKAGELGDIIGLLGDKGGSSPLAGTITNNIVSQLSSKIGLSSGISKTIAGIAVPFIVKKISGFISDKGKDNEEGINELLGGLATDSIKDKLLGGLGEKFGF